MPAKRSLDRLRNEYDTMRLLGAVDALDSIRGILADGPNLEPPEVRNDLLKLHRIAHEVVNQGSPISDDDDKNPLFLACDLEVQIGQIREAADTILDALSDLVELCPDERELEEADEDESL